MAPKLRIHWFAKVLLAILAAGVVSLPLGAIYNMYALDAAHPIARSPLTYMAAPLAVLLLGSLWLLGWLLARTLPCFNFRAVVYWVVLPMAFVMTHCSLDTFGYYFERFIQKPLRRLSGGE